jgi:hypothetical protein
VRGCLVACLVALGGCGHVLYAGDASNEQDGWVLQVTQLRDGPNTFTVNHVLFFPENGTKFLWAHVIVKNNASISRRFNYQSCVLDWGPSHAISPRFIAYSLVLANYGVGMKIDFDAGEDKERYLGFVYPVEYLPTLLACGDNVVKLTYRAGNRAP